jgi:hypothetical protein
MFGTKKKAAAVPVRATRLSDARRASDTGLMRRREEYRGGGGPTAGDTATEAPGGNTRMDLAGDRIRRGALLVHICCKDANVQLCWVMHNVICATHMIFYAASLVHEALLLSGMLRDVTVALEPWADQLNGSGW